MFRLSLILSHNWELPSGQADNPNHLLHDLRVLNPQQLAVKPLKELPYRLSQSQKNYHVELCRRELHQFSPLHQ